MPEHQTAFGQPCLPAEDTGLNAAWLFIVPGAHPNHSVSSSWWTSIFHSVSQQISCLVGCCCHVMRPCMHHAAETALGCRPVKPRSPSQNTRSVSPSRTPQAESKQAYLAAQQRMQQQQSMQRPSPTGRLQDNSSSAYQVRHSVTAPCGGCIICYCITVVVIIASGSHWQIAGQNVHCSCYSTLTYAITALLCA